MVQRIKNMLYRAGNLPPSALMKCLMVKFCQKAFPSMRPDPQISSTWFASYGDRHFFYSRSRIRYEAVRFGFGKVKVYEPTTLPSDFRMAFESILKMKRGGGYMVWKFCVLLDMLASMQDGDILVYCDAGCTINPKGRQRFLEYLKIVKTHPSGMVSFMLESAIKEKLYESTLKSLAPAHKEFFG